jgi:eukaryotic-like serine/threonine-protein kinase
MTMRALTTDLELRPVAAPARRFRPGERICPGLFAWKRLSAGRRTEHWLAWSTPLWSRVAVKLPREEHLGDERASRRLGREARMLRRMAHPGIQRLLEDGHADPVPHLVLEYVEGPTLAALVDDRGRLNHGDVVRTGMHLAAVLHYLHDWGLVHLALRPATVALRDGRPVLLDFDLAREAGRAAPSGRHSACAYMAPEQCLRSRTSPLMDLFALGAVLYELATGGPAFCADDAAPGCEFPQLLTQPARARALVPSLPPDLDDVVHALLERDARRRPQTALEALRLLASALPAGEEGAWPPFVDLLLRSGPC